MKARRLRVAWLGVLLWVTVIGLVASMIIDPLCWPFSLAYLLIVPAVAVLLLVTGSAP